MYVVRGVIETNNRLLEIYMLDGMILTTGILEIRKVHYFDEEPSNPSC